jgi:hypothetical protein
MLIRVAAQQVGQILGHFIRAGRNQVDFVDHRDDGQVGFERQVQVRQGLGFHALGGIHHQQRAFAGCQRPADLIVKVDMPGGIDQVQLIGLAILARYSSAPPRP